VTALRDRTRGEAFAQKIIDALSAGVLSLMTSVGHWTGLFDAMAGTMQATNAELAAKAGLQERYGREWLGAVTVGGIIEHALPLAFNLRYCGDLS
jgi:hypothetical protein